MWSTISFPPPITPSAFVTKSMHGRQSYNGISFEIISAHDETPSRFSNRLRSWILVKFGENLPEMVFSLQPKPLSPESIVSTISTSDYSLFPDKMSTMKTSFPGSFVSKDNFGLFTVFRG